MRYEINSSSIKAVEETVRGTIIIEFHNRGEYEYFGVPYEVIQGLVGSTSVGRFFNQNIRDQYRSEGKIMATINGRSIWEHTISSGKLQTAELLRAFSDESRRLHDLLPDVACEASAWAASPLDWASLGYCPHDIDWEDETLGDYLEQELGEPYHQRGPELLAEIQEHLNSLAPEGWYFGAHHGDGADFGWWKDDQEDMSDDLKILLGLLGHPGYDMRIGHDSGQWVLATGHNESYEELARHEQWSEFTNLISEYSDYIQGDDNE